MAPTTPPNYHALTPNIMFKDTQKAIEFYKKAFGAIVVDLFPNLYGPGMMHATIKIGNSMLMMGDEVFGPQSKSAETIGASPITLYLYVPEADAAYERAVAAGATSVMPMADMFWGDRAGAVVDPFGYQWTIATHTRDMSKEEVLTEARSFFARANP